MNTALPILGAVLLGVAACATPRPESDPTPWRAVAAAREASRRGDATEAVRILRMARSRHPGSTAVRRELGLLLATRGDAAATDLLAPLASASPPDEAVLLALARLALRASDPDTAARHLARLAETPDRIGPAAYEVRAEIALQQGEVGVARSALRQALVLDPTRPQTWAALLRLAERTGDEALRREARAALERACPRHPALAR